MNYLNLDKEMFYSIVNMKLRDFYSDIEDLCLSEGVELKDFINKMQEYGFEYNSDLNRLY